MVAEKLTLTIVETAKILGISIAKAYEAARTGQLSLTGTDAALPRGSRP